MTKHLDDLGPLSAELALIIKPFVEREVEKRVGELELRRQARARDIEYAILDACKKVADAVDAFDLAKFSAREIAARREVAKAAARLRNLMRKREAGG